MKNISAMNFYIIILGENCEGLRTTTNLKDAMALYRHLCEQFPILPITIIKCSGREAVNVKVRDLAK